MASTVRTVAVCVPQVPFFQGGAERHAEELCRALNERGYEATRVSVPFRWYPREQIGKGCLAWRLLDLTESNGKKIDLVIATKFPSYVVRHERKVVWLCHQFRQVYDLFGTEFSDFMDSPEDRRVRDMVHRVDDTAFAESRRIFTISRTVAQRLSDYNGIAATPLYHPPPRHRRYRRGEMGDYVLSVGRLEPLKRLRPLVEAMRFTSGGLRCVIAGTGPESDALQALIEANGLRGRVELVSGVGDEELVELYSGALVVYCAPYGEDLGYVTLEAFLSGKPVVTAPDAGGPTEFVEHEVSGLVSDLEAEHLAEAFERLHGDRIWAAELGDAGYRGIEHINWDDVVSRLVSA